MLKSGTVITCPTCGSAQMKTTKDLLPGHKMLEAEFESMGFDTINSIRAGCYKCAEKWYRAHPKTGRPQIHTEEDGWIPLGDIKSDVK